MTVSKAIFSCAALPHPHRSSATKDHAPYSTYKEPEAQRREVSRPRCRKGNKEGSCVAEQRLWHDLSFRTPLHHALLRSAQKREEEGIRPSGADRWLWNISPRILTRFSVPLLHPQPGVRCQGLALTQMEKAFGQESAGPVWAERVLSHTHRGRPGASALGRRVVPTPGPSHPGLGHPQNPARPRTSLKGASARRPPHSVGVPSSWPRVGQGTPAPAPWASNCCLGAFVFPPLGQLHGENPRGKAVGGSCYGKRIPLWAASLQYRPRIFHQVDV